LIHLYRMEGTLLLRRSIEAPGVAAPAGRNEDRRVVNDAGPVDVDNSQPRD
jgi:hypothetical protein